MKLNLHKQASPVKIPGGGIDAPQPIKPIFKSQQLLLQKAMKAEEDAANAPQEQEEPDLSPLFDLQKTELENQFLKQQLKLKEMHHAIEKGMVPDEKGGEDVKIEGPHPAELKAHKAQLQVQLLEHKLKLIEATQGAEGKKEQGPHPAELEAHKAKMESERSKHELALKETQHKHEKELAAGGDAQTKGLLTAQLKQLHSRIDGVHRNLLKSGGLEKWAISARPIPAGTPNPAATPKTTPPASTQPPSGTSAGSGSGGSSMPKITIPSVVPKSNPFAPSNSAPSFKFPSGKTQTAGAGAPISDNPKKMTSLTPGQPANLPGSQNPLGLANLPGTNAPANSTAPGASNSAFNGQLGALSNIGGAAAQKALETQTPSSFQGVPASMAAADAPKPVSAPAAPGSGPAGGIGGVSNSPTPMPTAPAAGGVAATTGAQGQPAGKQTPGWFQQRQSAMSGGIKGAPSMGADHAPVGGTTPDSVNKTVSDYAQRQQQARDTSPAVIASRQKVQNEAATAKADTAQRTADYNTIRNGGTIQATGPGGKNYGTVSGSPMAAAVPGAGGQASKVNAPGGGFSAVASASDMLSHIIKAANITYTPPAGKPLTTQDMVMANASGGKPAAPLAPGPVAAPNTPNLTASLPVNKEVQAPVAAPKLAPGSKGTMMQTGHGGVTYDASNEKAPSFLESAKIYGAQAPDETNLGKEWGAKYNDSTGHPTIRSYLAGGAGNVANVGAWLSNNLLKEPGKAITRHIVTDLPADFNRMGQGVKDVTSGLGQAGGAAWGALTGSRPDAKVEDLTGGLSKAWGGLKGVAKGGLRTGGDAFDTALQATPLAGGSLKAMLAIGGGKAVLDHTGLISDSQNKAPVSSQSAIASAPSPGPTTPAPTPGSPADPNPQAGMSHANRATQGLPGFANSEGYFGANPYDPSKSNANVDWAQGIRYDNPFAQAAVQFAPSILGMMGMGGQVRPPRPSMGGGGGGDLLGSSPTNSYFGDIYSVLNNNPGYGFIS